MWVLIGLLHRNRQTTRYLSTAYPNVNGVWGAGVAEERDAGVWGALDWGKGKNIPFWPLQHNGIYRVFLTGEPMEARGRNYYKM